MAAHTNESFIRTLRRLMAEHEVSFRNLEQRTKVVNGKGLSNAYLSHLAVGRSKPTVENLYVIARALGEDPRVFSEYREHLAAERARQLVSDVGLDEVLAKLDELSSRAPG